MVYLEKVAVSAPDKVNQALLEMHIDYNTWIHDAYQRIASLLPPDLILEHVKKIKQCLRKKFARSLYKELPRLIQALVAGDKQHFKAAVGIASAALSATKDSLRDNSGGYPHDYEYLQLVLCIVTSIGQKSPPVAIRIFSRTLKHIPDLKLQDVDNSVLKEDQSTLQDADRWLNIRMNVGKGYVYPRHALVIGLKQSLELLMQGELTNKKKVDIIEKLLNQKHELFKQLSKFVVQQYKTQDAYNELYTKIVALFKE